MRLLTRLRDANGRVIAGIDYIYVDLSDMTYVNRLLDHKAILDQGRTIPSPPIPLWTTLLDQSPKFFNVGQVEEGHPWFGYQQQIAADGHVELPEHYDPVTDPAMSPQLVTGVECHCCMSDDGVSWALLVSGRPAGSSLVPYALLYRAAGAIMPEPIAADVGRTDALTETQEAQDGPSPGI